MFLCNIVQIPRTNFKTDFKMFYAKQTYHTRKHICKWQRDKSTSGDIRNFVAMKMKVYYNILKEAIILSKGTSVGKRMDPWVTSQEVIERFTKFSCKAITKQHNSLPSHQKLSLLGNIETDHHPLENVKCQINFVLSLYVVFPVTTYHK